ncbi:histidine utilization repressor [Aestuariirhabdus litorea]|uniref:Histidine utilization repressor n=1 Tax=Aestuariirhabdus litorea TaxID=2528527 RepID=A0A3P3VLL5_9GAMM|nr:histidine utilization repressor [Aestuariirhabdus litorea]RRJ83625.1 histidine utilization repressor [Aestuariirhabdus litorea]RWW96846.1 histidine utilization repressor [Endozoicomonadaceae bacterium GTF-13]
MANPNSEPRYLTIKRFICEQIEQGVWPEHSQVPSENSLCEQFGVSRMTARRALQELTGDGVLLRHQGLGTFVAERKPVGSLLEVRNIADDISQRGHRYSNRILCMEARPAGDEMALALDLPPGSELFRSVIVHLDNEVPVQWEERYTNPALAPDYLQQDFSLTTPNRYLSQVAPLAGGEHTVEAVLATEEQARALEVAQPEACLLIKRRTWSSQGVVSYARLLHPGSRYQLGARLVPGANLT